MAEKNKTVSFVDSKGGNQSLALSPEIYREASAAGLTVPQLINTKYPTAADAKASTFDQMAASVGLFQRSNKKFGLRPPTMDQVLNGTSDMSMGTIVREANPASRILFPAVILEMVENKLQVDRQSAPALFDQMIAVDTTVAGARTEQPVINYTKPEAARSMAVSQLTKPPAMLTITTADVSRALPTFSLGLEISHEAMKASTLDLVSLAVSRQAEVEKASRVDEYINALLLGDADHDDAALTQVNADVYDSTIAADGVLTQKAWIKYLYNNSKQRTIDWVMCDLDTARAIEDRTGRPTVVTDDPNSPRIDALSRIANPAIQNVKIFLLEDGVIPTNTIMGIDSRYAIQRVRNSEAEYSAIEEFVLRKGTALRFDFSEVAYRLFDDAFDVMSLTNS